MAEVNENKSGLSTFYFTFGSSPTHAHPRCCQPIVAKDYGRAREIMVKHFGDKWAFQYTSDEWEQARAAAAAGELPYDLEPELPTIFDEALEE